MTKMAENKTYLCIDLKSFFASVECVERGLDPLCTNLVVADAALTEKTICLAVSPSLKKYGIGGRARLFEVVQMLKQANARRRFQAPKRLFEGSSSNAKELDLHPEYQIDYIIAPPRMAKYMEYSTKIYNIYLKYVAPEDIHAYSIDEVFVDITQYLILTGLNAYEFAGQMIKDVLKTTGITATAGIGTNLYLAKIAMDIEAKHIKDKLAEFGFDVEPSEVGQACANILAQIIRRRSEGLSDDVTALNYQRMETGRSLKNIAPATIERRGDKLHISGEVITIHQALVPDDVGKHELDYIRALYEAYAQKLNKETFTADDVPSLPKRYAENYKEQRMAYYSAVSIERSVRDIFDDGEDEFGRLKDDAWHGINTTYWRDYEDGYARLNAVLEKITSTTLDSSVLSQMRNLIGNLEKKGICHILVNDGVIESWVNIDE